MWSDNCYDYFMTSDGYIYKVLRNLEREAAEARFERAMYWINIKNRAMLYFVIAFLSMDVVFLTLLIWFGGVR
jgi:hypothetical protein